MNSPENFLSEDCILLEQIAQGSEHAFNSLFEKYWGLVYVETYKRLKNSEDAKDIVQEIFAHIWTNRQSLSINNLPAYLHVSVRNRVIKAVTKHKRVHPFFSVLDDMPELSSRADSNLLWKELFSAYQDLLESLPPKRRVIFNMRYHEGLSTRDIAARLDVTRKTIQNQLGKAIDTLKVSLLRILIVVLVSLF